MIPFPHGEPVTVFRTTPTVDPYNNQVPGPWMPIHQIDGVAVWPRTSEEDTTRGRQAVITGLTIAVPVGSDIGPHDRVEVRGAMYEVDGDVVDLTHPMTGWEPATPVNLRRVEG